MKKMALFALLPLLSVACVGAPSDDTNADPQVDESVSAAAPTDDVDEDAEESADDELESADESDSAEDAPTTPESNTLATKCGTIITEKGPYVEVRYKNCGTKTVRKKALLLPKVLIINNSKCMSIRPKKTVLLERFVKGQKIFEGVVDCKF